MSIKQYIFDYGLEHEIHIASNSVARKKLVAVFEINKGGKTYITYQVWLDGTLILESPRAPIAAEAYDSL